MILSKIFVPFKLRFLRPRRTQQFTLLDIGCGNHSPQVTKYWFAECDYCGVDLDPNYGNDACDMAAMNRFFKLDLSRDSLEDLPEADAIVMAHVIEHIPNGEEVLFKLCAKLKPSGEIFIETPAPRSVHFPKGRLCLNFYDDPSHVRLYDIPVITRVLESSGVRVLSAGTRRNPTHLWLTPLMLLKEAMSLLRYRTLEGPPLWDLMGFANYIHGRKSYTQSSS